MNFYKITLSTFLFVCCIFSQLQSQSFYRDIIPKDYSWGVGLGPSFAYLDNGGYYQKFIFEVLPTASVFVTKKLNSSIDLRATGGYQPFVNGGNPNPDVQNEWTANNSAFTVDGNAYYFDLMPIFNFSASKDHISRPPVNFFVGLGFGMMQTFSDQKKSFSQEEPVSKASDFTAYIPARAGLSIRISHFEDLVLEGGGLFTFSDSLDGNDNYNDFGDHFFNIQIAYRRYFRFDFDR